VTLALAFRLTLILGGAALALMAGLGACTTSTSAPPTQPPRTTAPELSGDVVRGGLLCDAWWVVVGADVPATDQPLWKTQTTNTRTGADTWRCKECHGWDYKGADGVYGSGSHATGFKGILGAASISTGDLTAWLTGQKDPDHDFSQVMDEAHIAALVTFMQKETFDSAPHINADGTVNGDAARGKAKYEKTCAACHGADGQKINFGDAAEPEYVGTVAAVEDVAVGRPGEAPLGADPLVGLTLGGAVERARP
jgi:thiosulfate dehydrogenase